MEELELTDLATLSYLSVMINNLEKDTNFTERLIVAEINEDEEDKKQVQKDVANYYGYKFLLHFIVLTSTKIRNKYLKKDITDLEIKKIVLEETEKHALIHKKIKKEIAESKK